MFGYPLRPHQVCQKADIERPERAHVPRSVARHEVFWRDWRDPHFAVCHSIETADRHVFGDVVFRSEPVVIENRKRATRGR
jgi:hypothetical protein